ncbi:MAG: hypothetical protein HUJ31_12480 [Pseudomonadales bacterium]|nr:hypothetical protein [Pseudomonadales bacterium]
MIQFKRMLIAVPFIFCASLATAAPQGKGEKGMDQPAMTGPQSEARQEMAAQRREMAEDMDEQDQEMAKEHMDEQAKTMQARKEERKEIKEEYKESGEKTKGKKPWWKFWE